MLAAAPPQLQLHPLTHPVQGEALANCPDVRQCLLDDGCLPAAALHCSTHTRQLDVGCLCCSSHDNPALPFHTRTSPHQIDDAIHQLLNHQPLWRPQQPRQQLAGGHERPNGGRAELLLLAFTPRGGAPAGPRPPACCDRVWQQWWVLPGSSGPGWAVYALH